MDFRNRDRLNRRMGARALCLGLTLALLLPLGAARPAHADANGVITAGLGLGVSHTAAPGSEAASTNFQVGARIKMLYFLGLDLMVGAGKDRFAETDQPWPRFRVSALLYLLNLESFALFGAGGLSSGSFSDVFDLSAASTYIRAGGGFEVTIAGHYSVGVEGYWFVPGLGVVNGNLNEGLSVDGELPPLDTAIPRDGIEVVTALRYFF
jgi:hypothetical protein